MIIDTNDSCGLGFEEVHATRVSSIVDMPIPRYKYENVLEEFV
jgi:hypothetical protein